MPKRPRRIKMQRRERERERESARAQALARVASLDFSMLKRKLEVVGGWSAKALAEGEHLYRRFLALKIMYPEKVLSPTPLIDEFWHAHILDTEAYTADCRRLFGRYVHHYPYVGLIDDVLALAIGEAVKEETRKLFQKHFYIDLQFS